jgi:cysteine desulfuration protein SufE
MFDSGWIQCRHSLYKAETFFRSPPFLPMPPALQEIIDFFEHLPEPERRENLINMAETASAFTRKAGQTYLVEDVRKDQECSDTVGVFLQLDAKRHVHFAIELGPKVQTLTRAMTAILCRGLNGCTADEILAVPTNFVPRIVGADLVRLRSQTVYYVLGRMKEIVGKALTTVQSTSEPVFGIQGDDGNPKT